MITGRKKNELSNIVFMIVSFILFAGFGFSEALISIGAGFIFLHILFFCNLSILKQNFIKNREVTLFIAIFLFYAIGFLFSSKSNAALNELQRCLFWFIIPVGVALTPKLSPKNYWNLLFIYVLLITVSSIYTTINYFKLSGNLMNFREASFIRHSSLSIYAVFAVFILIVGKKSKYGIIRKIPWYTVVVWGLWLVLFLSIQKSLLGAIALFTSIIVYFIIEIPAIKSSRRRLLYKGGIAATVLLPILYITFAVYSFYNIKEKTPDINLKTAQGNHYSFNLNNKVKENGRYVYWYICFYEMDEAWHQRFNSSILDKANNNYPIYEILIRYLTSKGLKKDASGVNALTLIDYQNIMNGVPNYIYEEKGFAIYPRIYQTIWELDVYFQTGNPNDKSFSQRIEFLKAAVYIIKENPWGVGVGKIKETYQNAYIEINSQLKHEFRIEAHNQYLNYAVKFGILGALVILILILLPVFILKKSNNQLLNIFLVSVAIICFGDNFFELHTGLTYFTYIYSFILWHSPNE